MDFLLNELEAVKPRVVDYKLIQAFKDLFSWNRFGTHGFKGTLFSMFYMATKEDRDRLSVAYPNEFCAWILWQNAQNPNAMFLDYLGEDYLDDVLSKQPQGITLAELVQSLKKFVNKYFEECPNAFLEDVGVLIGEYLSPTDKFH